MFYINLFIQCSFSGITKWIFGVYIFLRQSLSFLSHFFTAISCIFNKNVVSTQTKKNEEKTKSDTKTANFEEMTPNAFLFILLNSRIQMHHTISTATTRIQCPKIMVIISMVLAVLVK